MKEKQKGTRRKTRDKQKESEGGREGKNRFLRKREEKRMGEK